MHEYARDAAMAVCAPARCRMPGGAAIVADFRKHERGVLLWNRFSMVVVLVV
jgi:hypothetical protein